jgi:hypothetical protein
MNITMTMSNSQDTTTTTPIANNEGSAVQKGVAGRINYAQWDKVTRDLVDEHDAEEAAEAETAKAKLGLDGKYARSAAEKEERAKAKDVKKAKETLDKYKKREAAAMATFTGLLGPVVRDDDDKAEEAKATEHQTVRLTRHEMDAGKRVLTIADTSGNSLDDTIVLSADLSHLESKINLNAAAKSFAEDSENAVPEQPTKERIIYGIIKAFLHNVHNCTIIIKCKIISGTLELHNCSNLKIRVESEATVATLQADLSKDIIIEFRDAPSGKNTAVSPQQKNRMYWGEDADDRIFHAGVSNLTVRLVRDDMVESEVVADYLKDGAASAGNATAEEMQFVTAVLDGKLVTDMVVRAGSTTGRNVRAMTQRELDEEEVRREKAASMAIAMAEDMMKITDKDGNLVTKKPVVETAKDDDDVEEVLSKDVKDIVDECVQNKARGNEAFGAGEYGQAILLYSLSLDKAEELPDDAPASVFARDVILSNRAACFLKLGQHEKAEEDARKALGINPDNLKALFRQGLALHAMKLYRAALPILAQAHKLEPQNKQVKQALQFAEVRLAQEERKRMQG